MHALVRPFSMILACSCLCLAPAGVMAQEPGLAPDNAAIGLPAPATQPRLRSQPLSPVSPAAQTKTVLAVAAYFAEKQPIAEGLLWRVFSDQSDINGNFPLVAESSDAQPLFTLDPGGYVVHVGYGLATATEHVVLGSAASTADLILNAGAIRLNAIVNGREIDGRELSFQILKNEGGIEHSVLDEAKVGDIIRLKAGSYEVASTYGTANARIQVDLDVEPGKLTDATVNHKAASIRLKLTRTGSDIEIGDATWSILTPGGDPVTTSAGAVSSLILAEGDYIALAQYAGQTIQKEFTVRSGETTEIALSAQ